MRLRRAKPPPGPATELYYASDIHGSDLLWRKFLGAARFYEADALVMGGDLVGKAVVPVERVNGHYRVRFLGGIGDRDLPAFYNLASVYVGASRRAERLGVEGFGISLVEASACGLPVVAGNSGGVPDAVRDGETGVLVPPEEPAAFADAICRLLADPAAARRMGQNGRRAVETYFNWDRVVRDLRDVEAQAVSGE